ncbi:MAG: tRNA (N6-isopentenyl adenosine(37)-C2)-methylthiotransferase MiaB [Spirochaetota bacterium]
MPAPNTFFIETYGCQMNKADSASIRALLIERGMHESNEASSSDVVIINTCVVREHAEERIYGRLGHYRHIKERINPRLKVVITGCISRFSRERLISEYEVDIVADVYRQADLADRIASGLWEERTLNENGPYRFKPSEIDPAHPFKAFVSITHGCDNWCSYCVVPKVRGPMVSRASQDIIAEVKRLVENGVKEITLLGQNVNSYGQDIDDKSFVDLLVSLNGIMNNGWLRFLTSHPKDFSRELADAVIDLPSVCEHVHLPVQSGSDRILTLMRRKYTRADYIEKVSWLRARMPDLALSTDIIVGFADETDAEFEETLSLLREIRFEDAYLYHYSEREGSLAANEHIEYDAAAAKARLSRLIDVQRAFAAETLRRSIGKKMKVLVDGVARDKDSLIGRSRENRMVVVPNTHRIGDIISVTATELRGHTFIAV